MVVLTPPPAVLRLRPTVLGRAEESLQPWGAPRAQHPARYLLGRQFYAQYSLDGFRRSVAAFEKALAIDPQYAPAWAGLASRCSTTSDSERDPAAASAVHERALAAAECPIALDPQLAEAHSVRSYLRGVLRWDWRGAEDDMQRALALEPGDATVLRRHGLLCAILGRPEEAAEATRKALEVDRRLPAERRERPARPPAARRPPLCGAAAADEPPRALRLTRPGPGGEPSDPRDSPVSSSEGAQERRTMRRRRWP